MKIHLALSALPQWVELGQFPLSGELLHFINNLAEIIKVSLTLLLGMNRSVRSLTLYLNLVTVSRFYSNMYENGTYIYKIKIIQISELQSEMSTN